MRLVAAISQRFQTCSKLCMQLGGKTEVNMAHKQLLNCIGIAAGLHLQKFHCYLPSSFFDVILAALFSLSADWMRPFRATNSFLCFNSCLNCRHSSSIIGFLSFISSASFFRVSACTSASFAILVSSLAESFKTTVNSLVNRHRWEVQKNAL